MTQMLDAALDYVGRGWPVFPVEPGGKRPLGRLVPHGLKEATTDANVIRKWWAQEPEANVGLLSGHAFDVLDVDGEAGWSTLARTVAECGCLSSSPVSMTGGGGAHYLFLPAGARNRAAFLPSLDWRGRGGYIVAPPSVHPNGNAYSWAMSPEEVHLEAAPRWLVGLVNRGVHRGEHQQRNVSPRVPLAPWRDADGSAYVRAAIERECGRLALAAVGTRNDTLNQAAFNLGQLVGARLLGANDAGQALLRVALGTGLGEQEAVATIESGLRAGMRNPRRVAS